jgi:hypothetical protein
VNSADDIYEAGKKSSLACITDIEKFKRDNNLASLHSATSSSNEP